MTPHPTAEHAVQPQAAPGRARRLPALRIGVVGGVTAIMCCVGPTVLALIGVIGAATAFSWATTLYDQYTWWFRLGGLLVMAGLIIVSLRRRNQCSLAGARRQWRALTITLAAALTTYVVLYVATTVLGNIATS